VPAPVRVLGLGNELLGDDAFGILAARQLAGLFPADKVEVVSSSASGLHLLDYILDCSRLIVVDTVQTGRAEPGAIYVLREEDLPRSAADCPHGVGLFDALRLARQLGLNAPEEITIIAVEAADCHTVGGPMHPAVAAAIPRAVDAVASCCG
jgi:hydrogenase maturation protease